MQIDRQNVIKEHTRDIGTYSKKVQDNWKRLFHKKGNCHGNMEFSVILHLLA